eukprot:384111-Rhodomonas_salina.6
MGIANSQRLDINKPPTSMFHLKTHQTHNTRMHQPRASRPHRCVTDSLELTPCCRPCPWPGGTRCR